MAADSVHAPDLAPETGRPQPEGETSMLKPLTCALALLLALATPAPARRFQAAPTVIIVVRHGEKVSPRADALSLLGQKRAIRLATITQAVGVDAILVTQTQRTRQTAEPTATRLNVPITEVPGPNSASPADVAAHVDAVRQRILSDHRGQAVLVVGHSNTAPKIAGALGNRTFPNLNDDNEFDAIFFVVVPETGPPHVVKARY
jgi:broad specificity phosphatase PhoE